MASTFAFGQMVFTNDSLMVRGARDFLVDDYGSVYIYRSSDFSLNKYDADGVHHLMMTVPFAVENVQNPLRILLFSENGQELKTVDQNLNEIEKIDFREHFGFVKAASTEDQQKVWVVDASQNRIVQFDFRNKQILRSLPLDADAEKTIDILVYNDRIHLISKDLYIQLDYAGQKLISYPLEDPKRLRRENDEIYIVAKKNIYQLRPDALSVIFAAAHDGIVEKNNSSFFELSGNYIYLYAPEKPVVQD